MAKQLFKIEIPRSEIRKVAKDFEVWIAKLARRITAIVQKYTRLMWQYAHDRVPVDTGRLQKSLEHRMEEFASKVVGYVYSKGVDYARFVEYGTIKMAMQPFLRPAFERYRRAFVNEVILATKRP